MAARIGQHLAAQGHVLSGVTNIRPDGLRQTTIFHTADQRLPAEILRCTLNVWRAKDAAPAGIRLVETDQPRRDASGGAAIRIELGSDLLDYDSRLLKATKWRTAVTIQTESPIRRMALAGGLLAVLALGGCMGTAGERPQAAAAPIAADPKVLDLAERAVQQNRLDDARRLLERVFAAEPTHARGRLIMGEIHLAGGASEQAAQQFEALVEHSELKALAWQGLGTARLRGGDHEGACQALRHAVAADANLWRAWNGLGYCHDTEGNWSAAEAGYARAIALNPKAAWLYNNRGFSRMLQQRLDAAVADFGRALQIDPNLELAKLNLRLALARSGRYAQALVGTAGKDAGPAMNNVGYVAMLNGDLQTAETYLQRAMAADAGFNQVAWRNLGYLQGLRAANGPAAPVAAPAAMPADPAGKKP
jgi:Flp pilus assembly protein TadD